VTQTATAAPARQDGGGRWPTVRRWAATAVRVVLAGLWMWAGAAKAGDPAASLRAVRAYRLLPEWLVHVVGYGLPFVEITLAVLLLVGLATRLSAVVSAVLLVVFIAGVASAAARGLRIECGCFGGGGTLRSGNTKYTLEILRDVGLLLLSVALALWPASRYSVDGRIERGGEPVPKAARVGPRHTREAQRRLHELAERRRREARRRLRVASAAAGVALVALGGIGVAVQSERNPTVGNIAVPTGAVGPHGTDGLQFGPANAPVTVDVYEDFQCPICRQFEAESGQTLKGLYQDGLARVRYHVVAYLNRASTTKYSSRSANVAACTADSKVFPAFHDQLFQAQPAEGSAGLTDDQMIEIARGVGAIEKGFVPCVEDGRYDDWVNAVTDTSSRAGINGTPTVLVNGRQVVEPDGSPPGPQTLLTAVQNASK
jgi:protein-disulfide isomerase/uncharacterized membrane protein YphA (DoxX/SURF4 family)